MKRYLGVIVSTCAIASASAYDEISHAHMTKEALIRSNLPGSTFFIDMGIYGVDGELFLPKQYWDMAAGQQVLRQVDSDNVKDVVHFEQRVLTQIGISPTDVLRASSWVLRGTIREDDTGKVPFVGNFMSSCWSLNNPRDDPYNPALVRVTNHFFDPVNNLPLNGTLLSAWNAATGAPATRKAPDWAMGVVDAFASPATVEPGRSNHFAVADIREAMWRALTGTRLDGTVVASTYPQRFAFGHSVFGRL